MDVDYALSLAETAERDGFDISPRVGAVLAAEVRRLQVVHDADGQLLRDVLEQNQLLRGRDEAAAAVVQAAREWIDDLEQRSGGRAHVMGPAARVVRAVQSYDALARAHQDEDGGRDR